jgi:hypothetical protein
MPFYDKHDPGFFNYLMKWMHTMNSRIFFGSAWPWEINPLPRLMEIEPAWGVI